MTNAESDGPPRVIAVEAQLFVSDVNASCRYYTSTLGFTVGFEYGEPPFYAQVHRGGARLNLRWVAEQVFVAGIREREQLLSASMTLGTANELRSLFIEYRQRGVDFRRALTQEPWGATTFIVSDPDGNLLLFAASAA